jgi:hypothetical protein
MVLSAWLHAAQRDKDVEHMKVQELLHVTKVEKDMEYVRAKVDKETEYLRTSQQLFQTNLQLLPERERARFLIQQQRDEAKRKRACEEEEHEGAHAKRRQRDVDADINRTESVLRGLLGDAKGDVMVAFTKYVDLMPELVNLKPNERRQNLVQEAFCTLHGLAQAVDRLLPGTRCSRLGCRLDLDLRLRAGRAAACCRWRRGRAPDSG